MSKEQEAASVTRKLIEYQYFGVLATAAAGQPGAYLMAFVVSDDLKYILLATDIHTRKYTDISENRKVSFLIDNRNNTASDLTNGLAVTALGVVAEAAPEIKAHLLKLYSAKYPSLSDFITLPDTAVICMAVGKYIVSGFKYSQEILVD